jgi:hypothetical protein
MADPRDDRTHERVERERRPVSVPDPIDAVAAVIYAEWRRTHRASAIARALAEAGWLRTAEDRAVIEAADVWLTCRERCNDPEWLKSYPEATDDLARSVAARRAAAGGSETQPRSQTDNAGRHCGCWHSGNPCCWCGRDDDAGLVCAARPDSGICTPGLPHTSHLERRAVGGSVPADPPSSVQVSIPAHSPVVDLMAALEDSVNAARAARDKLRRADPEEKP